MEQQSRDNVIRVHFANRSILRDDSGTAAQQMPAEARPEAQVIYLETGNDSTEQAGEVFADQEVVDGLTRILTPFLTDLKSPSDDGLGEKLSEAEYHELMNVDSSPEDVAAEWVEEFAEAATQAEELAEIMGYTLTEQLLETDLRAIFHNMVDLSSPEERRILVDLLAKHDLPVAHMTAAAIIRSKPSLEVARTLHRLMRDSNPEVRTYAAETFAMYDGTDKVEVEGLLTAPLAPVIPLVRTDV